MKRTLITRRTFLTSAAGACLVAVLPRCSSGSHDLQRERRLLLRMARMLYPHDSLHDDVYTQVLQPLYVRASRNGPFTATLRAGHALLDADAGGDWLAASPDRQLEALARQEDAAFFQSVQNGVRSRLYRHPAVWKLVGYEGSSVEFGGYIDRGFDDIDWLPEEVV